MKLRKVFTYICLIAFIYLWPTNVVAQTPSCDGYVSRGDGSETDWDWDQGDLTEDGNWHDLDLTSITGDDTHIVVMRVMVSGAANCWIQLRQNGISGDRNVCMLRTSVSGIAMHGDCLVSTDGSGVIEYKFDPSVSSSGLFVRGWWEPCEAGNGGTFAFGLPLCISGLEPPPAHHILEVYQDGTCWSTRAFTHTSEHENGGVQEINVTGLSGILTDTQDTGWFQGLAITITGLSDNDVLAWNALSEQWEPTTITGVGGITMPEVITAVISGTVPVAITDTWHYTQGLSSGNNIAIMRSFTYGEASIAIGLFLVAALLGLHILFTFLRR